MSAEALITTPFGFDSTAADSSPVSTWPASARSWPAARRASASKPRERWGRWSRGHARRSRHRSGSQDGGGDDRSRRHRRCGRSGERGAPLGPVAGHPRL